LYARDIIRGRWEEAEPTLLKNPQQAYFYARYVIKGRFPEAEPAIVKNSELASKYAKDVMHDPYFWKKRNNS